MTQSKTLDTGSDGMEDRSAGAEGQATSSQPPPYETPDAVITRAYHHHKRLDGDWMFRARVRWAKLLRRKLPTQHFMVWIIYREWQERVQIVKLEAGAIGNFVERLMDAPMIRQVHVSEFWFKGRKSFGVDFDPDKTFQFLVKAAAGLKAEGQTTEGSGSP